MRGQRSPQRLLVFAAIVATALVSFACGKRRVDPALENRETRPVWDPPTEANGFHTVTPEKPEKCIPDDEALNNNIAIARSSNGTLEDITFTVNDDKQFERRVNVVAADNNNHTVYWTQSGESPAVLRASRTDPQRPWEVERIAVAEAAPGDIAVGDQYVYWTVGDKRDDVRETSGIRFFDKWTRVVGRLATEAQRPERLVAEGDSVFWIAAPNHVREAKLDGPNPGGAHPGGPNPAGANPGRPNVAVRDVFAVSALNPSLLAVDRTSLYAFTEQTLLRIPRNSDSNGSRKPSSSSVVLVPTTTSTPVDITVDANWVYWLESGPQLERCGSHLCGSGCNYGRRPSHPQGSLRRVPTRGGSVEVVATNLPDVQKLAFRHGIAWIVTESGLLRVDPTGANRYFVEEGAKAMGRPALVGDALVFGMWGSPSKIALLSRP